MATVEIDAARAEAFGGRMLGVANDAFLALTIGLGHSLGLYDALAGLERATSADLAAAAGLEERYVREWLAGQLVGGIVEHDPDEETWRLPPEHAASLTRAAGPGNLAFLAAGLERFAAHTEELEEAFRSGGGVPWSHMTRLQEWQADLSRGAYHGDVLDRKLAAVPGLVERLRSGLDVLDAGCGHGAAAVAVAEAFHATRVVGYDVAETGVAAARAGAAQLGIRNVRFERRDVADLAERESYDVVLALDVVHDLARPYEALRAFREALRPGGVLLVSEHAVSSRPEENVGHPFMPALYVVSLFHCLAGSLSEGGAGLGLAWGDEAIRAALADAGFVDVELSPIEDDPFNAHYVARRP
jgi:2-polyprenyl-3-methyl-5-hydroxy-6-metoxy-1,4-benzoquinol methylase